MHVCMYDNKKLAFVLKFFLNFNIHMYVCII